MKESEYSDHQLNQEDYFVLFLKKLTDLELIKLRHEMKGIPEDKNKLIQIDGELKRRIEEIR